MAFPVKVNGGLLQHSIVVKKFSQVVMAIRVPFFLTFEMMGWQLYFQEFTNIDIFMFQSILQSGLFQNCGIYPDYVLGLRSENYFTSYPCPTKICQKFSLADKIFVKSICIQLLFLFEWHSSSLFQFLYDIMCHSSLSF